MRSHVNTQTKKDELVEAAEASRLLSDPTRLRILKVLFKNEGDMCVYEIAEKVGSSPSATSHQLAKLEAHNIVRCYRDGQKMCYELTDTSLVARINKIFKIFNVI